MCGIAGSFSARPLNDSREPVLMDQLKAILHRGPDAQTCWLEPKTGIALGHTRLSINDLEGGAQPIHSQDQRYVTTVNGEFYDFKKYRSLLMAEGQRFASKSDSEIAIGLYRKMGMEFLKHLRGEFAFVLYDREHEELLIVRDRWGIRPLFIHLEGDHTIHWGSEVKALLAHPDIPAELDPKAAVHQLMQTIAPGMSAFRNIHSLSPGHAMRVRKMGGRLETETIKYWDLDFPEEGGHDHPENEAHHVELIREQLTEAVVLRLEADVPVGCYLSGGIDSCCILGLASGAMQAPVKAFTIAFDNDDYDESGIAREMAVSMNADQEMITLAADDLYGQNYIDTVWHAERTFYNTLGVAKNLMSKRVWDCGYRCVVTGEGSDELFAGYPGFKKDMFLHGIEHEPEHIRAEYKAALEKTNSLFKGAILSENERHHPAFDTICGFTPSWIQPWMETLELAQPLLNPDHEELRSYDPIEEIASRIDGKMMEGRHPLDRAQYTWAKCQLEGQILNWGGDRVDMANSMESRPAFLDHHLAEAAFKVPPHYRIKGNIEKYVLREAVRGVLPDILYKREKFAFMAPPAHTDKKKQAKVNELIDGFLNRDAVERCGILSSDAVDGFIRDYRADTDATSLVRKDALLNHLLGLHILHHHFCG